MNGGSRDPRVLKPEERGSLRDAASRDKIVGAWRFHSSTGAAGLSSEATTAHKLIANGHWCVTQWDRETGMVVDHRGGTYARSGNEYVETVRYGTNPKLTAMIGVASRLEVSVESNVFTQQDRSTYESWSRVKTVDAGTEKSALITGAWLLSRSTQVDLADLNCVQIIVDGRFCIVCHDRLTGAQILHVVGGTYTYKRGEYVEILEYGMPYPEPGKRVKNTVSIQGNTLRKQNLENGSVEFWTRSREVQQ